MMALFCATRRVQPLSESSRQTLCELLEFTNHGFANGGSRLIVDALGEIQCGLDALDPSAQVPGHANPGIADDGEVPEDRLLGLRKNLVRAACEAIGPKHHKDVIPAHEVDNGHIGTAMGC